MARKKSSRARRASRTTKMTMVKSKSKEIMQLIMEDPVTQEYMEAQKQLFVDTIKKALDRIEEISRERLHEQKSRAVRVVEQTAHLQNSRKKGEA